MFSPFLLSLSQRLMIVSAPFRTNVFSSPFPLEQDVHGCVITAPPNSEQTTIIS